MTVTTTSSSTEHRVVEVDLRSCEDGVTVHGWLALDDGRDALRSYRIGDPPDTQDMTPHVYNPKVGDGRTR